MKKLLFILPLLLSIAHSGAMEPKKRILLEDNELETKKIKIEETKLLKKGQKTKVALSKLPRELQKYLIPFFSQDEFEEVQKFAQKNKVIYQQSLKKYGDHELFSTAFAHHLNIKPEIKENDTRKKIIHALYRYLQLIPRNASLLQGHLSSLEEYMLEHTANQFGTCPVDIALRLGSPSCIEWLKAELMVCDQKQLDNCLQEIVMHDDNASMVNNLNKAAPYLLNYIYEQDPLLILAARYNTPKIIEVLLRLGVDVNVRNHKKRTALIEAINANCEEATDMLLTFKADPNLRDEYKNTALTKVFSQCSQFKNVNLPLIQKLIDAGANKKTISQALFPAIEEIHSDEVMLKMEEERIGTFTSDTLEKLQPKMEALAMLINAGADVNITNSHGDTPLLSAIQNNSVGVVKILLKAGAYQSIATQNDYEESPFKIAFLQGQNAFGDTISSEIKSMLGIEEKDSDSESSQSVQE